MGIVYKARKISIGGLVALKVLPPAFASDPLRLERFRNEARLAAQTANPHVLPVNDFLWVDGVPVIVMPYIDGNDLGWIIKQRRKEQDAEEKHSGSRSRLTNPRAYLDRVLPLLDQLVEAVAALHDANVLHRDIKPPNCLVDRRNHLSLCDFGLARLGHSPQITLPGAAMGTRGYVSPEQALGREDVDKRADVFSLGVTIYHALTLTLPYNRDTVDPSTMPPTRPSRKQSTLSSAMDAVILKALEPNRDRRYRDANEFQEDWRLVRSGLLPRSARLSNPLQSAVNWGKRHRGLVGNVVLLTVLVGLLGGLFVRWWSTPPDPDGPRVVRLGTVVPCKRFAFVPLDPETGEPLPRSEHAVRGPGDGTAQIETRVRPGDYLVVIEWPDGRFHEVYRRIAPPGVGPGLYVHNFHEYTLERETGIVELRPVGPPSAKITANMVYLPGGPIEIPQPTGSPEPPSTVNVDSYYLDPTEVTVSQYRTTRLPLSLRQFRNRPGDPLPPPENAVFDVEFDMALHCLEVLGKRPPTEAEYLFAATNGATTIYPWGNDPAPLENLHWRIGAVGLADFDQTRTTPPIRGLYSNVAEWTSTWWTSGLRAPRESWPSDFARLRVVRGAPRSVLRGSPDSTEFTLGPSHREYLPRTEHFPLAIHVGIRGARSTKPRFLDPEPPVRNR